MTDQFDPAKPCRTKCRWDVRIYATDGSAPHSIHGAYLDISWGGWVSCSWDFLGRANGGRGDDHRDLVNVTPDVVEYCNIYPNGIGDMGWRCRAGVDSDADHDRRIAVLKITIRDGRDVSVEVERV